MNPFDLVVNRLKNCKMKSERNHNKLTSIKIKTLNNSIFEVFVELDKPIFQIQSQIEQKTNVPVSSQRLLFRGLHLQTTKAMSHYKIEENSVLVLIANKIPSEQSQKSSLRTSEVKHLKSINKEHQKYKKHMYLQQRPSGFRISESEVMEVLQQNKSTINQLLECINHNYSQQNLPYRFEKRRLKVGEWIDVRDISGQWAEAQIINIYNQYVLVHYNGWPERMNEWISNSSERIMPFRSHTVQSENCGYLSPIPKYQTNLSHSQNTSFQPNIETFIGEFSNTLNSFNNLLKELQLENKEIEKEELERQMLLNQQEPLQEEESVKNLSNNAQNNESIMVNIKDIDEVQFDRKQQFYTPSKEIRANDNLSNKAEDDVSKGDKDDISNKSFKSKRSEGLVDTQSMKSLIIDEKKRSNKIFFDSSEAHSVKSVKNKNVQKTHYYNQEYILEESDSQLNEQQDENLANFRKKEYKRKMKASQLAPLADRLGRLLVDLAPQFAMLGYHDQAPNYCNENLSTFTNEGSLESRLAKASQLQEEEMSIMNQPGPPEAQQPQHKYCQFQIPVMLTPSEISKITQLIQKEKRQNNMP